MPFRKLVYFAVVNQCMAVEMARKLRRYLLELSATDELIRQTQSTKAKDANAD